MLLAVAVAISTAVMVGAMLVGHSMRASLQQSTDSRLGQVQASLSAGDRFLGHDLVKRFQTKYRNMAGMIQLPGTLRNQETGRGLNRVTVNAVDRDFWSMSLGSTKYSEEDIAINSTLAKRLNLNVGDLILLKLSTNPMADSVMSQSETELEALELKVTRILTSEDFGEFNLAVNQLPPYNLFLSLQLVQEMLEKEGRINLVLSGEQVALEELQKELKNQLNLDDLELRLEKVGKVTELRSTRIFLEEAISDLMPETSETKLFTYLVNSVRKGELQTPYPLVMGSSSSEFSLKPNEIILTDWMANDLQAQVGDQVQLNFYVLNDQNQLRGEQHDFMVRSILPVSSQKLDPKMMPDYPGLKDSEHCRDWNVGFEIDLEKIRDKDEKYWDTYKGRPKAIIAYDTAKSLWRNRYGDKTALRYSSQSDQNLKQTLENVLKPEHFGLFFMPNAQMSQQALAGSMDFSSLFMGFSCFICIAVLTLTHMLFKFLLEERKEQYHLLSALGFDYAFMRKQFVLEFLLISIPGSIVGIVFGVIYSGFLIDQLNSNWKDAIGDWDLFVEFDTIAVSQGVLIGVCLCLCILGISLKLLKRHVKEFSEPVLISYRQTKVWHTWLRWSSFTMSIFIGSRLFLMSHRAPKLEFFLFGALLLLTTLMFCLRLLSKQSTKSPQKFSRWSFIFSQMSRRRGRSLAVMSMLSCGAFMMISLEVFRMAPDVDTQKHESGSGGYQLLLDLTRPLDRDLNLVETQKRFALDPDLLSQAEFASLRVSPGEDASCLNLNRAQRPNLIGIPTENFAEQQRFSFAAQASDSEISPWLQLKQDMGQGKIPIIGDQNALLYSLGKGLGDVIEIVDERGVKLELVVVGGIQNSIFQSSLLMDEEQLLKYFPSISGFKNVLVHCDEELEAKIQVELNEGLESLGADVVSTQSKMMSYNRVQNSYISIFQTLGLLGLVLGCSGLCLVVIRNINDREKDFLIFSALGQTLKRMQWDLLKEHMSLFIAGIFFGFLSGLLATWPILQSGVGDLKLGSIFIWMLLMLLIGVASIFFGYRFSTVRLSLVGKRSA